MSDTIDKNLGLQEKEDEITADAREISKDASVEVPDGTPSFADLMISRMTKPLKTFKLEDEATEFSKVKDVYTEKFGSKAKEEFSKIYNKQALEYQQEAEKELNKTQVLQGLEYLTKGFEDKVTFIGDNYVPEIDITLETNSGRQKVLDSWTDATRSVRKAAIEDGSFVDWKGEKVEVPGGLYDGITNNSEYTNDKGKEIYGFEYLGADEYGRGTATVKALYDGEDPEGEVVSRWDANGFFEGNNLDMSMWKVPIATTVNFAADIADTALALGENAMVLGSLGAAKDSDAYNWIRDSRNKLKSFNIAKSDKDQSKMFTVNNMLEMGLYTGLQLLSGRAMATAFGSIFGASTKAIKELQALYKEIDVTTDAAKKAALLQKVARVTKRMESAGEHAGKATLFMLGAMQAKDASDEARKAGFSELESATIYAASLGGMMWVNSMSELGFEKLGINKMRKITKEMAKNTYKGVSPSKVMSSPSRFTALIKEHGNKVIGKYKELTAGKGYMSYMLSEAAEEEAELVMQEVINHTATAVAALGYDKDKRPAFKTVFDKGYWSKFATDSVMNMLGGAMGGAMNRGFFAPASEINAIKESELPITGKAAEDMKRVAFASTRTAEGQQYEVEFLNRISELNDKGYLGRSDISIKYDDANNRYKLMSELSDDEKLKYPSQADMIHKSTLAQYHYYKQAFALENKSFKEIVENNPTFAYLAESKELQRDTIDRIEAKSKILEKASIPDGGIDSRIQELIKIKESQRPDDSGKIDTSKYDEASKELSTVTDLSQQDIDTLVDTQQGLNAISTGEILETSFVKLQLTKEAYNKKDLFSDKGRFERLINADKDLLAESKQRVEQYVEDQKIYDEQFRAAVKSGELSFDLKRELLKGNVKLSENVKEAVRPLINDMGIPLEDKKRIAMQSILKDIISLTQKSGNNNLLNKLDADYNIVESNAIKQISDAIMKDPTSVPQVIDSLYQETTRSGDVLHGDTDENIDDAVTMAYMISRMGNLADANTEDALLNKPYDPKNLTITGPNRSDIDDSVFNRDFIFDDPTEPKTIEDIIGIDATTTEKAKLLSALDGVKTYTGKEIIDTLLHSFDETNPNKTKTLYNTLAAQYEALVSTATLDEEGNPKRFANLEAAKDLHNKSQVKLAQIQFLAENIPALSKIRQINEQYFTPEKGKMTYLTDMLTAYGIDFNELDTNPDYSQAVFQSLSDKYRIIHDIVKRSERLVELAENASQDLFKAYIGDAVTYAGSQIKSVATVLDREATKQIIDKRPRLEALFGLVNGADFKSKDKENIDELYDRLYKIREILSDEKALNDGFVEELISIKTPGSAGSDSLKDIVMLTLSPADYVFGRMRESYSDAFKAAKESNSLSDLKLPTIRQMQMVEEAVVSATTNFTDYVRRLSTRPNQKALPIAIFSGLQGTGKTHVVAVEAAKYIQEILSKNSDKIPGVMFASNSEEQARRMRTSASVVPSSLNGEFDVTQDMLWNALVGSDTLPKDLDNVGVIIYDEISHVEFMDSESDIQKGFDDPKDAGVLNAILAKLSEVNDIREQNGKPKIIILGLGDSMQGGFMEGAPSPRNKSGNERLRGGTHSVYSTGAYESMYVSKNTLKHQFRYEVADIQKAQKDILDNMIIGKKVIAGEKIRPTEFIYKRDKNDYTGVEKPNSWESVYSDNDLVDTLRAKMKEDDFELLVISGAMEYDSQSIPPDSPLGKFLHEYKDSDKVRTKSFYKVQGDEATYVLVNVPDNHLIFNREQVEGVLTQEESIAYENRVKDISMVIGRARRYTNIVMGGDWNVKSIPGSTTVFPVEEADAFKSSWGDTLINSVLKNYDSVPSDIATDASSELVNTKQIETHSTDPEQLLNQQEIKVGMLITLPDGQLGIIDDIDGDAITVIDRENGSEIGVTSTLDIQSGKAVLDITKAKALQGKSTIVKTDAHQMSIPFDNTAGQIVADEISVVNAQTSEAANTDILKPLGLKNTSSKEITRVKTDLEEQKKGKITEQKKDDIDSALVVLDNINSIIQGNPVGEEFSNLGVTNESDTDTMINIERTTGEVVFFGHVGDDVTKTQSVKNKINYANHLYGKENTIDLMKYDEEFTTAMGLGARGIDGMDDYKYHLVSYEFKFGASVGFNHVVVAEKINGGKKLILADLGKSSRYAPDPVKDAGTKRGLLYQWMIAREQALKEVTKEYLNSDGKNYPTTVSNIDIVETSEPGEHLLPPTSVKGKIRSGQLNKRFSISSMVMDPSMLFNGVTVGNLVNQGKSIQEIAGKMQEIVNLIPNMSEMHSGEFVKSRLSNTVVRDNIMRNKKNGRFYSMDEILSNQPSSIPFEVLDGKYVFRNTDDNIYVNIKTPRGTFPFFYVGTKWVPALGYNIKTKKPILDVGILERKNKAVYDAELDSVSKALTGLYPSKGHTININADNTASLIANSIGYNYSDISKLTTEEAKIGHIRRSLDKKLELYFGNTRLPLDTAKKLWKNTGAPSSVSAPYIIMRHANDELVGKSLIFYTFDTKKNLAAMSEKDILSEYTKMVKEQDSNPTKMSSNRNGLGFILLDSEPQTIDSLDKMYMGMDQKSITKYMNKVVMSGSTGNRLISLLANVHIAINSPEANSRVYKLAGELKSVISAETIREWGKNNKGLKPAFAGFLTRIFEDRAMGALAMADLDEDLKSLSMDVLNVRGDVPALKALYNEWVKTPGILDKLNSYGINENNLTDLIVVGGADSNGRLAVNKDGLPKVIGNSNSVITYPDPNLIEMLGDTIAPIKPSISLDRLLAILNTEELSNYKSSIIGAIDSLIPLTDGLHKGLFVSPLTTDTANPIAKAHKSTNQDIEKTLTTSVKQIKVPSIVFNVEMGLNPDNFAKVVKETKKEAKVSVAPISYENQLLKADSLQDLRKMYAKLKQSITSQEDLKALEDARDKAAVKFKTVKKSSVSTAPIVYRETKAYDYVGTTGDENVDGIIKAFDNLSSAIPNIEMFKAYWVEGLKQVLGDSIPLKLKSYVNSVVKSGDESFGVLSDEELWRKVKELKDSGVSLPPIEVEVPKSLVEDWKSKKNTMGNRLETLLAWNMSKGSTKTKYEKIIDTDPNSKEDIEERTKLDSEVLATALSVDDIPQRLNLLNNHFSDIKDNYYNSNIKMNAVNGLRDALNSIPEGYPGKQELIDKVDEFIKTNILTGLVTTSYENLSNELGSNDNYISNTTQEFRDKFKKEVLPLIEEMPNLHYLWTYISESPEVPSIEQMEAQMDYEQILRNIPGLSEEEIASYEKVIDKLTGCK